jgi:hypothetical protein
VAPDSAVNVPANADVDQVGRLDDSGEVVLGAGLDDKWVRLYKGVSDGDKINKWWDMATWPGAEPVADACYDLVTSRQLAIERSKAEFTPIYAT